MVKQKEKEQVFFRYNFQLVIADFMFLLSLPFSVSQSLNDAWIYSEFLCKLKETVLF